MFMAKSCTTSWPEPPLVVGSPQIWKAILMRVLLTLILSASAPFWSKRSIQTQDGALADRVPAVEAYLQKTFPRDQPGAAVVVIQQGKVLLCRGYGLADLATKTPIDDQTSFDLASVSKQFTAMAAMILFERGKLDPEEDIRRYFLQLPAYYPDRPIR